MEKWFKNDRLQQNVYHDRETQEMDAGGPITVEHLLKRSTDTPVAVQGLLLVNQEVARMCSSIKESYPPQCGEPSVELAGLDLSTIEGTMTAHGVTWKEGAVLTLQRTGDGRFKVVDVVQAIQQETLNVNKCVRAFGLQTVCDIINRFEQTYNKPIVSIGSGNGILENCCQSIERRSKTPIKFICVDPDPMSYSNGPVCISPDYDTTTSLINAHPEIVQDCLLLLNWCDANESTYDYQAIIDLKPLAVLSLYEVYIGSNGAAGGEKFYQWIQSTPENGYLHAVDYRLEGSSIDEEPRHHNNHIMDMRISWHHIAYTECNGIFYKPRTEIHYIKPACLDSCRQVSECCIS